MLYAALLAPIDHPYYQEEAQGSEYALIKEKTEIVPIGDYPKYQKELARTIGTVMTGGASLFLSMEE